MSNVSLTAGFQANLFSLQKTQQLLDTTQERLSTGKKINSALDDPINFFTAQAHRNRATDLTTRKDQMGETIQIIRAAENGIKAMASMIESAKALATAALVTTSIHERNTIANQYNETLTQIGFTANDSGYKGINLLQGTDQVVEVLFDESGDSKYTLQGVDATPSGLKLNSGVDAIKSSGGGTNFSITGNIDLRNDVRLFSFTLDADGEVNLRTFSAAGGTNAAGDTIANIGFDPIIALFDASGNFIEQDDDGGDGLDASITRNLSAGEYLATVTRYSNFFNTSLSNNISTGFNHDLTGGLWESSESNPFYALDILGASSVSPSWYHDRLMEDSIGELDNALSTIRTYSKTFTSGLNLITTRLDFNQSIVNILNEGVEKLENADLNEEGAKMLMLQTRQQLATSTLSMAAQASQSVLRLFY